jgi:hypothetical protein
MSRGLGACELPLSTERPVWWFTGFAGLPCVWSHRDLLYHSMFLVSRSLGSEGQSKKLLIMEKKGLFISLILDPPYHTPDLYFISYAGSQTRVSPNENSTLSLIGGGRGEPNQVRPESDRSPFQCMKIMLWSLDRHENQTASKREI